MTAALLLHRADGALPDTAFRQAAFGPSDPFAAERRFAWRDGDAICAGRMVVSGERDIAPSPHTEMLVVVAGELALRMPGAAPLVLGPGQGAVIACGTALQVQAVAPVDLVFCAVAGSTAVRRGITPLRADADFRPSNPPPAEVLLGPAPQCRSDNVFQDAARGVQIGTWDSTPYHRIVRPHRVHELMVLLAGSVHFAAPDGSVLTAGVGDAVFVARGAPIGWLSTEHVAKFYLVQDQPA